MKLSNNEKKIINLIKYGAIILIIIFSLIISEILMAQKNKELNSDIKNLEENFLINNKNHVENLVNKIFKFIKLEEKFERDDYNDEIVEEIEKAYSIASFIYNENIKKPDYTKEKTLKIIKSILSQIRFHNNGYLFIYDMNGENILNSEFPKLEGKNHWNMQDSKGTYLLREMNSILNKQNETFYEWYWKKNPKDNIEYKKIGFFKKFEPYNLFIGTGYYEDEFSKKIENRILEKINNLELKKQEHIFIYNLNGLCLANPKKELIGTNRINIKNSDGKYALKDTIEFIKEKKEGFISYTSTVKLNKELTSNEKISFVKLYDDLNWMIGSGFYLEELQKEISEKKKALILSNKDSIEKIALLTFCIAIIMIFISFYISKIVNNMFINYKERLDNEMKKLIENEKLLIQQSKMATMGEMIGSIAHQWKQPLGIISISNSILKINNTQKDFSTKEELDELIDNIDNSVYNLSHTIDDFRNFFSPNKRKSFFKIKEAFIDTFKLINSQFKNNDIEIIENIENVELFSFKNELLQVFINLLKNSKEELVKKPRNEKRYIFIDVKKEKELLIIKIKDNANGIPNNILDKVFKAYFTTKEKEGGTGIGLYMSKQIIEESIGGKIEVYNKEYIYENKTYIGAEFLIKIPINTENR